MDGCTLDHLDSRVAAVWKIKQFKKVKHEKLPYFSPILLLTLFDGL